MNKKRVTSNDVAEHAGVSRTTVSLVLNNVEGVQISEETRQRVIDAALELGYVPNAAAQALASRRAQIIGLLLTRNPHHISSDIFLNQILDGLITSAQQHSIRLLIDIVEPRHQKKAYLELVRAKRIDGLILSGPRFNDEALFSLQQEHFPTVLMGQLPDLDFYSVDIDNYSAAKNAVNHLISLGHKEIACVTNAHPAYSAAADRLRGYQDALESAGIPFLKQLVRYGDFDPESGFQQMKSLLADERKITAVFVASDVVAIGAKAAIVEWGLHIPQDIALVGFDDVPLARYLDPPLSTVRLPASELAKRASQMLIRIIQGDPPRQKQVLLDSQFIVRQSCGAHINPN
ncbi:MAG: LacI family DNA-binding transcriptional regulator [Chloroflexota bacterium]|nr:MAG: LacI family DNA-binding transcriptional regulator [Chloroflexota bacterium]